MSRGGGRARRVAVLLAVAAPLCVLAAALAADVALARAGGASGGLGGGGGGGRYGGGGGFGGGGYGYGYGGGGFGFLPLFLLGGVGGGGLLVTVIVAYALYALIHGAMRPQPEVGAPAPPPPREPPPTAATGSPADPGSALAGIREGDPGFSEQVFLDRAQAAFFLLQKAWQDRDIDEGRAFMSPGLYTSWRSQVEAMAAQHRRNVLEDLQLRDMRIVAAGHDDAVDTVTVRVDAAARDRIVDDQTGRQVEGDRSLQPFTEHWTFMRSAGARTMTSGGVVERRCPNCGAPLSVNEVGSCRYCGAAVTSGKFDWVLTRIDQAGDWS